MRIKDIAAYRRHLQAEFNVNRDWEPDFMGSRTVVEGKPVDGFFKFWQSSTAPGREAVAGKLRGVLEMAQNDQAIYEITQNAADCGATDLRLWYNDEQFLAFNDGEAFTPGDVKSILDTFGSEKALRQRPDREGMIGQYGVGFKLFHRLVGRESGLEELLDQGAGPMIFSWNSPAQLEAFLQEAPSPWELVGTEQDAPWLFKILLTCFPAAPGEMVRDIHYQERVAFTIEEAEAFRSWARSRLGADRPVQGSLFFLTLGEGKRDVLDRHMDEIRSCMGVSMHFLRKLETISVNNERIERVKLDSIELRIPKEELHAIGLKDEQQDVDLVFAYSVDAMDQLVKEPTLYQYFPMTKEAHGMAYVIHSNGLQKQAQRTELNADSEINARLMERLTTRVTEQAMEWMQSDPEKYRDLFKVILLSAFEPSKLKVLHEKMQQPLIELSRTHVPTMDGQFQPADQVLVSQSKVNIPLEEFGIERHWFHWRPDQDADLVAKARDNARLGLKEASIGHLIRKVGAARMSAWLGALSSADYETCLLELKEIKEGMKELPDLAFIRVNDELMSLNQLLSAPRSLGELQDWYNAHPHLNEWFPPKDIELLLVSLVPEQWNASVAALLLCLTTKEARVALLDRLPRLTIAPDSIGSVSENGFMQWWAAHMEELPNTIIRKKLMLRINDEDHPWEEALILEQVEISLPSGTSIKLPLDRLLPARTKHGTEHLTQLHDDLEHKGFSPDFLEMAFKRRKKQGKEELTGLGDRLTKAHNDGPLANGSQLLFAIALKHLHPEWKGLEQLELRSATGECFDAATWWCLSAPAFVDQRYILHGSYSVISEHLGDHWDPIKFSSTGLLAARPRLGEAFTSEILATDLDEAQRISFLNWLLAEHERNTTALDHIRTDKFKLMLESIFGSHPGIWLNAEEEFTRVEERIPTWVAQWAGRDQRRLALVEGLRSHENATVAWRKALLNDEAEQEVALPSSPVDTLHWIVDKGGAETFVSALQETRITKLLQVSAVEWKEEPALRLETDSTESSDPIYLAWKAEGAGWTVYEYPGDLPMSLSWEGQALVQRHGIKFYAPPDGTRRIFLSSSYMLIVALYQLSEGVDPVVPAAVRNSYQLLFDKLHKAAVSTTAPIKERPAEELALKQRVEHFREQQLAFSGLPSLTLAELVNSVEWEYGQKLLDRQNGNVYRFKEVEQLPDGVLVLRRPNVAELPYELVTDQDRSIPKMKLRLRKRGVAYQEITDFELLASSEGEVRLRVPDLPFGLNASTVAMIELPVEDMLMQKLAKAWRHIADTQDTSRSLIDIIKARAPGGQVGFIFGPPGTGKTTVLADRLIATLRETEAKVLVLTPTNTAADVLYERITEKASEEYKVLNGVHRFDTQNKDIRLDDGFPAVVITTMHRFTFDRFANGTGLNEVDWDHVVFDEASMAALAYALLPIMALPDSRGESSWGALGARFLIAGDPFQLMPVGATPSLKDKIDASKKGQRIRGYATENIFTWAGINSFQLEEAPALPGARIVRLDKNYRSGSSIVQLFSDAFYESGVSSARGTDDHAITLGSEALPPIGLWSFPVELPSTSGAADDLLSPATIIPFENSSVHVHSALLAARLAVVLATENAGKRVIIICPYGRQVRVCQALLEPFNKACPEEPADDEVRSISVSSVHRYQGGEAEIVIFLLNPTATKTKDENRLVIGDIALFNDPNLINVAISRARDVLVLLAPEDKISRSGYSGYLLMDRVLGHDSEEAVKVPREDSVKLESLLFNGQTLEERVSIMPIRAMDLYRVQDKRDRGTDLVVLHNKENLNMVMAEDIVMEGIDLSALAGPQPGSGHLSP